MSEHIMTNEPWRPAFHRMFKGLEDEEHVLKIVLNKPVLYKYDVTPLDIVTKVDCEIDPHMNHLYVPIDTDLSTLIKGDANIKGVDVTKDVVVVETPHKRYREILSMDFVDKLRTSSSNVWDIYETLGIEAVREYLLEELKAEMNDVHETHLYVLVDKMVFTGDVFSVNRYSTKKENTGVFAKASFEETFEHFLRAALNDETDNTNGLSSSIFCGKTPTCGTEYCRVI